MRVITKRFLPIWMFSVSTSQIIGGSVTVDKIANGSVTIGRLYSK